MMLLSIFAELMVETGPTQTQKHPIAGQTNDQITRSIQMQDFAIIFLNNLLLFTRDYEYIVCVIHSLLEHGGYRQLKAHFETPGSSEAESLNQLARGMDKKRAAALFLRTCGMFH